MVPIEPTAPAAEAPAGMVAVPRGANYTFTTRGIEIEGDDAHGVDVQFTWEPTPRREHSRVLDVPAFFIDKYPVTNGNYSAYLSATGFAPADAVYWLRHWELVPPPQQSYTAHDARNCFGGHGAKDIDATPLANSTAARCQARCSADVLCACAAFKPATRECWKRAQCMPNRCPADAAYNTYAKNAPTSLEAAVRSGSKLTPTATALGAPFAFDFFIQLSDADLPLRTDAEMVAFLERMRGRSMINVHEGGGPTLLEANRFIDANIIVECGGYGFVVVNKTSASFPLTAGCCIGRSGPAAFAPGLPLAGHALLDEYQVHTGSQGAVPAHDLCRSGETRGGGWASCLRPPAQG